MYNPNPSSIPPPGYQPGYGGPPPPTGTPAVVMWFRVYCGFLAFMNVLVMGLGIFIVVAGSSTPELREAANGMEPAIIGALYAVLGFAFAVAYSVGLFIPRKPWGWIAGIVLIALGMTSLCCLPAAIPLLIFWLKPETKSYFGRS